jgi:hypothetical protein
VEDFLADSFHLPRKLNRKDQDYPALPLLLSLLDTAIDRGQPFAGREVDRLREVRAALEYLIFAVLEEQLRHVPADNPYQRMLEKFTVEPTVISLNYDLITDNVLFSLAVNKDGAASKPREQQRLPNYGCDIQTAAYRDRRHDFGLLLKIHGSLNWLYCPNCHRLDIGLTQNGGGLNTYKVLNDLYTEVNLHDRYSCQGAPCKCGSFVRPVLITPTHKKDYRNPHISRVWYEAERTLREADRVYFVGYSLPDDDVEVIYLLKRGLAHLTDRPQQITVVARGKPGDKIHDHEAGRRYRTLFGDKFDWRPGGFNEWLLEWDGL